MNIALKNELASAIDAFIEKRLNDKLKKEKDLDKHALLIRSHERSVWLARAATCASQVKIVTHIIKGMHSSASGTSLFVNPSLLSSSDYLSSAALPENYELDASGNAGGQAVVNFVLQKVQEKTFLSHILEESDEFRDALSTNASLATSWMHSFQQLVQVSTLKSHPYAKQIYFRVKENALLDDHYELLLPLHASALNFHIRECIRDALDSSEEAKNSGQVSDIPIIDYPNLAQLILGGSNPQNAGVLSNKCKGQNFLLPSLPPKIKKSEGLRIRNSLYTTLWSQPHIRHARMQWFKFFKYFSSTSRNNSVLRDQRDECFNEYLDAFLQLSIYLRQQPTEVFNWENRLHLDWVNPLMHVVVEEIADDLVLEWSAQLHDVLVVDKDFHEFLVKNATAQLQRFERIYHA